MQGISFDRQQAPAPFYHLPLPAITPVTGYWMERTPAVRGSQYFRICGFKTLAQRILCRIFRRDTGIAAYLQRISSPQALAVSPLLGPLFEAWMVYTLYRLSSLLPTPPQFYHWRTSGGAEVDLIMELDGQLFPIEMKCKSALTKHDTRGLRAFRETYQSARIAPAIIVYAGKECYQVDAFTTAVPWNTLLQSSEKSIPVQTRCS